jgi:hypothetical protein
LNCVVFNPAASNACFKYGASNSTYRADVVVSGSNTPTKPLPSAANGANVFINEKSAVNAAASGAGTEAAGVLLS